MALIWNWNECIGTCTTKNGINLKIYKGNAFMIAIHEDEETNTYQIAWFFTDKEHLKNCIGTYSSFAEHFNLNSYYKESIEFAKAIAKAKLDTSITLKYQEP